MNNRLLASLEEAIDKWSAKQCVAKDWPDFSWPDNGSELIAKAASIVIDSFVAEKKYIDHK